VVQLLEREGYKNQWQSKEIGVKYGGERGRGESYMQSVITCTASECSRSLERETALNTSLVADR
jgi:hypothetical protein